MAIQKTGKGASTNYRAQHLEKEHTPYRLACETP